MVQKRMKKKVKVVWVKSVRDLSPFGCDLFDLPLWVYITYVLYIYFYIIN